MCNRQVAENRTEGVAKISDFCRPSFVSPCNCVVLCWLLPCLIRRVQSQPFQYFPRNPPETVLYQVVSGELETFLARQRERDREVPKFVEDEFRSFLECGILAHGFMRVYCDSCRHNRLVPFSCKRRGWCPSCGGRRMAETAAHLVDHVFPVAPVRQWVLSVPFALRYRLGYDSTLLSAVLNVFVRGVFDGLRRRAAELYGVKSAQCGAATFIQRFGDALNLAPHFHSIVLDGIYAPGRNGQPELHELPAPEDEDMARVASIVVRRVEALLRRRGLLGKNGEPQDADPASVRSRIAAGANTGCRVETLGDQVDGDILDSIRTARCATVCGFSVHANVSVGALDRRRLERLIRYASRPAVSTERLSELPDGRLLYRLKRKWRNGTTEIVFERADFIARLAALVPAPRAHLARYHGVLGPASKLRPHLIPRDEGDPLIDAEASLLPDGNTEQAKLPPRKNNSWASLLKRVFEIDVLVCELCGSSVRIIAAIQPPDTTRKILDCLGLPSRPPPIAPARCPTFNLE